MDVDLEKALERLVEAKVKFASAMTKGPFADYERAKSELCLAAQDVAFHWKVAKALSEAKSLSAVQS